MSDLSKNWTISELSQNLQLYNKYVGSFFKVFGNKGTDYDMPISKLVKDRIIDWFKVNRQYYKGIPKIKNKRNVSQKQNLKKDETTIKKAETTISIDYDNIFALAMDYNLQVFIKAEDIIEIMSPYSEWYIKVEPNYLRLYHSNFDGKGYGRKWYKQYHVQTDHHIHKSIEEVFRYINNHDKFRLLIEKRG